MRKKNCLLSLLTTMMVTMISVCFVSCGDSDNEDFQKAENLLLGTWFEEYYDGEYDVSATITFNSDGTGLWKRDYYYEDTSRIADRDRDSFTYIYNNVRKELTITLSYAVYVFKVSTLTKEKLELWENGNLCATLTRD